MAYICAINYILCSLNYLDIYIIDLLQYVPFSGSHAVQTRATEHQTLWPTFIFFFQTCWGCHGNSQPRRRSVQATLHCRLGRIAVVGKKLQFYVKAWKNINYLVVHSDKVFRKPPEATLFFLRKLINFSVIINKS